MQFRRLLLLAAVLVTASPVRAQQGAARPAEVKSVVVTSAAPDPFSGPAASPDRKPDGKDGKPPDGQGDRPDKDGDGAKKPEAKDGKEKPAEDASVVKRAATPPAPPDRAELRLRPGPDGKVRFDFRGQAWPDVLQWLADVSGLSLDWQELPADYLNLTTQRGYTVQEARDLINRHLLARGFTLLLRDEVLSVAKTDKLNAALVPRVEPEELARRMPHEFVKVSLPLDWLVAEDLVEELKPMLSPNGRLVALKTTNRVEAMDAVANLQEICAVLQAEQSPTSQDALVREFVLQFARADEVRELLLGLLGGDSKKPAFPFPMSPEQMQQMQQQQAQMMAQLQQAQHGGRGAPPTAAKRVESDVRLVVNARRNSVLVQAPPDKMAIIAKAIETIDVPPDRDRTLLTNMNRMQVYRLATLDPEALVKTLQETGDLDPTTSLQVDKKHKSIIAYASLADHLTIRTLVEKLDGSSRQFEVLRLRRLEADYVAGTIAFMMGQNDENKEERPRYWGYYNPYGSSERRTEDESSDRFRVDADTENNRLLLWANEVEMNEIKNLLVKLGEIPAAGANPERVRVIDLDPEEAQRLLERVRQAWPSLAPNKLVLPPQEKASPSTAPAAPAEKPATPPAPPDRRAQRLPPDGTPVRFAQLERAAAEPPADPPAAEPAWATSPPAAPPMVPSPTPSAEPPPVQVTVGPDGRLVLSSQDTQALDLLEELITQAAPPRKDYRLFPLKFASSYWVKLNLEDFFREGEKEEKGTRRYYFFDHSPPEKKKEAFRLSRRRTLKFIDDFDTNTVLVVGADPQQLKTIEELIRLWDMPPPTDSESARVNAVFAVRYSKAQVIAEAVKEVYRDLLSSNDKALQPGKDERRMPQNTYIFGDAGGGDSERRTQVSFKGKLSVGVDEISNTLIVSTEGQNLMENVSKMIKALDEAARPATEIQAVTLQGGMNSERVRQALARLLGQPAPSSSQATPQQSPRPPQPTGSRRSGSRSGSSTGGR